MAIMSEDRAGSQTARARCGRGGLIVEQPFVGAERSVKPHGVVEAGHLQSAVGPVETMGQYGGVEQGHVAGVGDNARVQRGIVGQCAVGAQPHLLLHRWRARPRHRITIDIPDVDGAGAVVPLAEQMLVRGHASFEIGQ